MAGLDIWETRVSAVTATAVGGEARITVVAAMRT
jgi:hypothetical protein